MFRNPSNHHPPGLPWKFIGLDYLGALPKSTSGKGMIVIAIDWLTKMARFIPTDSSVTGKETSDLFLREVF
jgi:hypothetical protein